MFKRCVLAAAVPITVVAMANSPLAGPAAAEPSATEVVIVVPVSPNGEPINGYQEVAPQGNVTAVTD
jgi:hypothetical protein